MKTQHNNNQKKSIIGLMRCHSRDLNEICHVIFLMQNEVLFAEIIDYYNPKLVELHNYNATGALTQKISNWNTLNRKVLIKLKLALKNQQVQGLANAASGLVEKLIFRLKKSIEKGDLPSPSIASKTSKGNTSLSFGVDLENKAKSYHKLPFNQIKKQKDVHGIVSGKDQQINLLKSQLSLLLTKSGKLQEMLKCKDKQIQQLVCLIKQNKK